MQIRSIFTIYRLCDDLRLLLYCNSLILLYGTGPEQVLYDWYGHQILTIEMTIVLQTIMHTTLFLISRYLKLVARSGVVMAVVAVPVVPALWYTAMTR